MPIKRQGRGVVVKKMEIRTLLGLYIDETRSTSKGGPGECGGHQNKGRRLLLFFPPELTSSSRRNVAPKFVALLGVFQDFPGRGRNIT